MRPYASHGAMRTSNSLFHAIVISLMYSAPYNVALYFSFKPFDREKDFNVLILFYPVRMLFCHKLFSVVRSRYAEFSSATQENN